MVDLIDLEAVVSRRKLAEIVTWVANLTTADIIHRILDVGTGTGAGAIALAGPFTDADIVAADISNAMLQRVRERAAAAGLGSRVSTLQLDMSEVDSVPTSFGLVWASSTLHEVADPDRALRSLFDALDPGGTLVVVEMNAAPTYLQDTSSSDLESRIHHILARTRQGHPDHPDWTRNLADAGFELIERRPFVTDERPAGGGPAGRLAHAYLSRIANHVRAELSPADRASLDTLLADSGSACLRYRDDLHISGTRTAWLARRP